MSNKFQEFQDRRVALSLAGLPSLRHMAGDGHGPFKVVPAYTTWHLRIKRFQQRCD